MKQKIALKFSLMLALASGTYAMLTVQAIPYLTYLGYDAQQRSYILSFSAFAAIVGQLYTGYLSDRLGTIKKILIFCTIFLASFTLIGYSFHAKVLIFHFIILSVISAFCRVGQNLIESWIMELPEVREQFSKIRGIGSTGWAIFSLIAAYIIIHLGYVALGIVAAAVSMIVILIARQIKDVTKENTTRIKLSDFGVLIRNPRYVLLLVIFFFIFFVMNADSFLVTEYVFQLGGNEVDIGRKWLIQGLSELPAFYIGGYLMHKLGAKRLTIIASILIFVRFVLYSYSSTVNQIILVSLMQMVTFSFFIIAQRILIFNESPDHLKSSGQMLAVSISMSLSSILTPIFSGQMMRFMDVNQLLMVYAFIMVIPLILMLIYQQKKESNND